MKTNNNNIVELYDYNLSVQEDEIHIDPQIMNGYEYKKPTFKMVLKKAFLKAEWGFDKQSLNTRASLFSLFWTSLYIVGMLARYAITRSFN